MKKLKRFFKLYYILHLLLVFSYIYIRNKINIKLLKKTDILGFEREFQIFGVLCVYLSIQYSKSSSIDAFLARFFTWCEITILTALLFCNIVVGIWYGVFMIIMFIVCPQPIYEGPTNVINMKAYDFDELVLNKNSNDYWLIQFYTNWAHDCKQFDPVMAELSIRYGTETLRFGRLNIGLYEKLAERFRINVNPMGNKELPTLILFHHGEPVPHCRLPPKDENGQVIRKVVLHAANVAKYFELESRMIIQRDQEVKSKPKLRKRR